MKKIVLASLLATGLMAAEGENASENTKIVAKSVDTSGVYIGVDIGNTKVKGSSSYNVIVPTYPSWNDSGSEDGEDDGGSQTFKIGYYINANSRISAFYHNINVEDGTSNTYGVGYDYLIGDSAFKPFIGVFAGRTNLEDDEDDIKISGNVFGAQAGVNYLFNDNFSVEAGYRYMKSSAEYSYSESGTTSGVAYSAEVKAELDTLTNWFVGINYKF